jgi:hypothetical protein
MKIGQLLSVILMSYWGREANEFWNPKVYGEVVWCFRHIVNVLQMPSGTLYCVALIRTDVSENIISFFWVPAVDRIPHFCYCGITVNQPLHRGMLFMIEEHRLLGWFMAVSLIDAFWDSVPCSCHSTATQLWNPISLRNSEDGNYMFCETSVRTRATRQKSQKASIIDTAVKISLKTLFFDHK